MSGRHLHDLGPQVLAEDVDHDKDGEQAFAPILDVSSVRRPLLIGVLGYLRPDDRHRWRGLEQLLILEVAEDLLAVPATDTHVVGLDALEDGQGATESPRRGDVLVLVLDELGLVLCPDHLLELVAHAQEVIRALFDQQRVVCRPAR
jgi:hypothetical protein